MIDRSVPYHPVYMLLEEPREKAVKLVDGYRLVTGDLNRAEDWIRIQLDADHIDSYKRAKEVWDQTFAVKPEWLAERMLFVLDPENVAVATVALWEGEELGRKMAQLHWLATCPEAGGKGLARALTASLINLYLELNLDGGIYLGSQTHSYPAINIYMQMGFKPYTGDLERDDSRDWQHDEAWKIIMEKIKAYQK